MLVSNHAAYRGIRPIWLISATRFGEQASIPYSVYRDESRFREIFEGSPYHEDRSSSLICGFSVLSRGREHVICLNP